MGSTARGWPAAAVLDRERREHTECAPGWGSLSWAVLTPAPPLGLRAEHFRSF